MDVPLGRTAGNALEVTESVEVLAGGGPADVVELTVALAREMLELAGLDAADPADVLADGRRHGRVARDGRAPRAATPTAPLPRAAEVEVVAAPADRHAAARLDAMAVGVAAWRLGAGRARKEDAVSATAGSCGAPRSATASRQGQPLLELHLDDPARLPPRARGPRGRRRDRRRPRRRPILAARRLVATSAGVTTQRFSTSIGSMPSSAGRSKPRTWA